MFQRYRMEALGLGLALFAPLLLAYLYYVGLYCSDDTRYLIGAIRIASGEEISTTSVAERRIVLLLPAAAMYALSSSVELSVAIYGVFFLMLGGAAFLLARQFFGPLGAAAAAVLAVSQPVVFLYAGAMAPDIASSMFLVASLYCLCRWVGGEHASRNARRTAWAYAFGAGVSLALGFVVKESGAVVLVIPAALLLWKAWRDRLSIAVLGGMAMAAGFVVVLLIEVLVFRATSGDWYSSVGSLLSPHDFTGYADAQGRTPRARLDSLRYLLGDHSWALFIFAGVATAHLLWDTFRRRLRGPVATMWWTVAAFWIWPLLYFTYGSGSLSEYVFPVMQQRYYAPCIVPAALLVIRLLTSLAGYAGSHWARTPIVAALCVIWFALSSGPYREWSQRGLIYGAPAKEAFELALMDAQRSHPGVPVVDTPSGWTTDLARCRALLTLDTDEERERFTNMLRRETDRNGRFDYPAVDQVDGPLLLVGHGDYLGSSKPPQWVRRLQKDAREGRVRILRLGRFSALPALAPDTWWLPRQFAARASLSDLTEAQHAGRIPERQELDEHARLSSVEIYLVEPSTRPPSVGR
ncbi:ArnT family glycosyltransferase [Luteimonas kalidii]|uniref:Glycosyltransferase family 39 protein n=1 Tax=Luteimonas kalidii TaxID=3042025 RepID=A0ABT6JTH6_9GAMM|nr:glycosyltransferase family 39 protein [Luteimonas kalidii]MDH5833990.1 glycosyltransferase family 39 protein [Luteimonas kalidii]